MSVLRSSDLSKGHSKLYFKRLQSVLDSTKDMRSEVVKDLQMKLQMEMDRLVSLKEEEEELFNRFNILEEERSNSAAGDLVDGQIKPDPYLTEPDYTTQARGADILMLKDRVATEKGAEESAARSYTVASIALAESDYWAKLGPTVAKQVERYFFKIKACRLNADKLRWELIRLLEEKIRIEGV